QAELNYEVHDKELLAIIDACRSRQGKTDALSRRADYAEGAKASESKPILFFPPSRISANTLARQLDDPFPDYNDLLAVGQDQDDELRQVLQDLRLQENLADHDPRWALDSQGLLRWDNKVYVPDVDHLRRLALQHAHDTPSAGHLGVEKTLERVRRQYYFPGLAKEVENYVSTCDHCFRNKSRRSAPHGLLQPLPPPTRPWDSIALDFIVKLPRSQQG
ncbi:hypothetical protein JCM8097_009540, partial [Rhodosporidiobolus ruineniae]